jgi:ribosome recycling factor
LQDDVQKSTQSFSNQIDEMIKKKETELMTI